VTNIRKVTVFGGTGFLGRRVTQHLLDHGLAVRVASRYPERSAQVFSSTSPSLEFVRADVGDDGSVMAALDGAFGVVNAVSLYVERAQPDVPFRTRRSCCESGEAFASIGRATPGTCFGNRCRCPVIVRLHSQPALAGTAAGIGVFVQNFLGAGFAQMYGLLADGTVTPMIEMTASRHTLAAAAGQGKNGA
jgi:NAD(P)H-binding